LASIRSNKNKGANLQKWVCEQLARVGGFVFDNQDDESLIASRRMGQNGTDVILRGKAKEVFPFSFECMSGESFELVKKIEQAKKNQEKDRDWVVVHRRKKWGNPIVMMDWKTFESLLDKK